MNLAQSESGARRVTLRSRVSPFVAGRVVISTIILGSATWVQLAAPGAFPLNPFYFLIGLTYGLSVIYLATLRYVDDNPWLVDLQLTVDAALVSAFVVVTGGIQSDFSSLYLLPILAASTLRHRRGALQVAAVSAVFYLAIVLNQYTTVETFPRWSVSVDSTLPAPRFAQYVAATNLFGFLAVGTLAGALADRLRSTGSRLATASETIEDLRAFNEHVINSLVSGLVTADTDCRILTFNRAASTITGVAMGQAVGRNAASVLGLPPHFVNRLSTLGRTRSQRGDFTVRTEDGRNIELGVTAAQLSFPDGRTGYLFTFQDVTDVKRLERESGMRQRLAAVGEMAAGIAHEIRNPLASMSGSLQVLRSELPLTEDQEQLMDIVLRESDRLNQTIRSFLAYARPQRATITRFDLAQLVSDTARLLRNGADVRDHHSVGVDAPADPVWLEFDENQMRQIVWNLATNGLRAMADGGKLTLVVEASDGQTVGLRVEDQGCGIAPADIDRIFQPFRSSFDKGTGLGLATVHRIVTDAKGTIHVSSRVGEGTSMRVVLPAAQGEAAAAEAEPELAGAAS
ncbi:MAG TPA: ATP-binding protein [Vicinamibacterales bacterium]|nr:ATP-binding protein [Vicinamibacterales bacterium]